MPNHKHSPCLNSTTITTPWNSEYYPSPDPSISTPLQPKIFLLPSSKHNHPPKAIISQCNVLAQTCIAKSPVMHATLTSFSSSTSSSTAPKMFLLPLCFFIFSQVIQPSSSSSSSFSSSFSFPSSSPSFSASSVLLSSSVGISPYSSISCVLKFSSFSEKARQN